MATKAAEDWGSMKLKIVVDKKKNRVVFAEAKKNFVDFIYHIPSLPLGAVQRVLTDTSTILGSLSTLLEGLKNLDDEYLEKPAKDYILNALKAPYWGKNTSLLLPDSSWHGIRNFKKSYNNETVAVELCNYGYGRSNEKINLHGSELDKVLAQGNEKGYVKEAATFMVMDNLVVLPVEPDTVISMYEQIKDNVAIEKREVTFGTAEAVKLLKASISSTTVLTDVFLGGAVKAEN